MRDLVAADSVFYLQKNVYEDYKEYRSDFSDIIRAGEEKRFIFLHQSPQISFRKSLVQYMKKVSIGKSLSHSCLHLSVYMLDMFMDNHQIIPERLLLVANVCLLLAAKLEESSTKIPKISELNALVNNKYLTIDYTNLEMLIIRFFCFSMKIPCAVHHVFYYMQEFISPHDLKNREFRTLFYEMYESVSASLDRIIEDVHYMQYYQPSKLAAAIIAASRLEVGLNVWSTQLEALTGYTEHDFSEILQNLSKRSSLRCSHCAPNIYHKI